MSETDVEKKAAAEVAEISTETLEKKLDDAINEASSSESESKEDAPTFEKLAESVTGTTRKRKAPTVFTYEDNHTNAVKQAAARAQKKEERKAARAAKAAAAATKEDSSAPKPKEKAAKKGKSMIQKIAGALSEFAAGVHGDVSESDEKNSAPAKAVAKKKRKVVDASTKEELKPIFDEIKQAHERFSSLGYEFVSVVYKK